MTARQKELFAVLAGALQPPAALDTAMLATEWTVITGAPGSGKSTVCEGLAAAGLMVVPEASRAAINEAQTAGFSIAEIFEDRALLAGAIMHRKLGRAHELSPSLPCAWDTGLVDALVFYRRSGADSGGLARQLAAFRYRRVIFLEPLPHSAVAGDPVRPQPERERLELHDELLAEYSAQGYEIARIPCDTSAGRMKNVFAALR